MPEPIRGLAYEFSVTLIDAATGAMRANPTIAAGDFQVSKDHGALANLTTLPSVAPAGSALVRVQLSATEMTVTQQVDVVAHDPDGQWDDVTVSLQPTRALGTDFKALLSGDTQPTLPANLMQVAGNATSPVILDRSSRTIVRGVVGPGATTTSLPTSSLTPAATVANQFRARVVLFDEAASTAALRGQVSDITASAANGTLTVTALTTAPVSGDTFLII